jgi:hypothetical protein
LKERNVKKIGVLFLASGIIFGVLSCQGKKNYQGLSLNISFSEEQLSSDLMTDVTYSWKSDSSFSPPDQEFTVYVHFWHKGTLLITDDHLADPSISSWEPEKEYRYSRRVYIPPFIDDLDPEFEGTEEIVISAGIYHASAGGQKTDYSVYRQGYPVYPTPLDRPSVTYTEDWYELEENPDGFLKTSRWTAKEARCVIDNPERDTVLIIKGSSPVDHVQGQIVFFKINDVILDEFVPEGPFFEKTYTIKKELMGNRDEFILLVGVDKTFVPARDIAGSSDGRELGVQIGLVYFH